MEQFGFSDADWAAGKRDVKQILAARAKVRAMIPYSDLVKQLTSIHLEAHDQRLFHLLGEVSSEEDAAGRGMLSVIVVHKVGDMQPGPRFLRSSEEARPRYLRYSEVLGGRTQEGPRILVHETNVSW